MNDRELTLLEHIQELRQRLIQVLIALFIGTLAGTLLVTPTIETLVSPLGEGDIIVLSPTEAPVIYFKVALYLGTILVLPFILYQIYLFIAPGLHTNERMFFLAGIPAALILFAIGTLFCLKIILPLSMPVLMGFFQDVVQATYSLEQYLSFVTTLLLWMGLLFETPLVIYGIARAGWVTPAMLAKVRKLVIFFAAVLAAVITPTTDPVTMLLVTGPFIVLYEVGLILARLAVRQRHRSARATG